MAADFIDELIYTPTIVSRKLFDFCLGSRFFFTSFLSKSHGHAAKVIDSLFEGEIVRRKLLDFYIGIRLFDFYFFVTKGPRYG